MSIIIKYGLILVVALGIVFGITHHKPAVQTGDIGTATTTQAVAISTTTLAVHVAPDNLYPVYALTPGLADTQDPAAIQAKYTVGCANNKSPCTYSQSHRNVSQAEKNQVYAEYEKVYPGITAYCHSGTGLCEVDHFCPVGIGCSNDIKNLWIERADTTYQGQPMGFHQKDDLETWGIAQVKAGKLTPAEFDQKIWSDWVAYYLQVKPAHTTFSN